MLFSALVVETGLKDYSDLENNKKKEGLHIKSVFDFSQNFGQNSGRGP